MHKLWLFRLALLLAIVMPSQHAAVTAQEGVPQTADVQACLALAAAIDNWPAFLAAGAGSSGGAGHGWNSSLPLCQWSGITCTDQQQVQSISLQCDNCAAPAAGPLPAALANLSAVTTINLQGNELRGTLPPEWGAQGALPALQNLYLNDNQFTGSLPSSWGAPGSFPQLSLLRLDDNRLTGGLPGSWGGNASLPNLLVLRLFSNDLGGPLPTTWGSPGAFPRLQSLALQNNSLTGGVPSSWWDPGAMVALTELTLQDNRLEGQLPASWGNPASWPRMRYFQLNGNPLAGTLPPEWGQQGSWPSLKILGLNSTRLTGPLPPEWGSAGAFKSADAFLLQRNNLTGAIPASWAQLRSLRRLVVRPGNPQLCGPIPPGLPFSVCTDEDVSCVREQPTLLDGECQVVPAPGAAVPPTVSPAAVPPQPAAPAAPPSGSSGGGVHAAEIAAPVAVGTALLAAAGLAVFAAGRRRKRRRAEEAARAAIGRSSPPEAPHPFDTLEGQAALTSPFAASAFHTAGGRSDGSSGTAVAGASAAGAPGRSARSRDRGPHDSVDTRSSRSNQSGGSLQGYLAKCARIETKSMQLGALPPAGSSELTAAVEGVAGSSSAAGGSCSTAGAAGVPGTGSGLPALPSGSSGRRPARQSGLELQPLGGLTAEEAAVLAEAGDVLGPGALLPLQQGKLMSSEETSESSGPSGSIDIFGDLPFSDWQISPSEIQIVKRPDGSDWSLGSGGFGKVYKALRHGVQPVAVKVLLTALDMRQMAMAEFRREVAILRACRDVNIVQFIGAHLGPDQTMLVTEYLEGGNLANNISAGRVTWYRRGKKIALDVGRGLVFLHSKRVVHLDIKSPNVLLARDGTAKIADVGMARILAREYVTGVVGTLAWAAPELLWGERCTEKADVYAYGILLWEICSGERPVRGQLRDLRVPEECPAEVRDLILECLETRPSRRPSARDIVQRLAALPDAPTPPGTLAGTPTPPGASPAASGPRRNSYDERAFRTTGQASAPGGAAAAGGGRGGRPPLARHIPPPQTGSGAAATDDSASVRARLGHRSRSLPVVPPSVASQVQLQLQQLRWQVGSGIAGGGGSGAPAAPAQAAPRAVPQQGQPGQQQAQQVQQAQQLQDIQVSAVRHSV